MQNFTLKEIPVGEYKSIEHRFFSYRLWKEERNNLIQQRAQDKFKRSKKRKERETDATEEEGEPKRKKSCQHHSDYPISSPLCYSPSSP